MSELKSPRAARVVDWGEFARYFAISGVGFLVDFAALVFGVEILGAPLLLANTVSFALGLIAVYIGSIFWAFNRRSLRNARTEFAIFCLIGVVGLGVNHLVLLTAVSVFALPYGVGKIAAAGASFVANFAFRKLVLFR